MNTRDLRLALCAAGELYGGVEQFIFTFANYLKTETELRFIVVLFHDGELRTRLLESDVDVLLVRPRFKYDPTAIHRIARLLKAKQINVVHTHGYKANIACSLAGKLCGLRTIKTEHGLIEPNKRYSLRQLRMRCNLLLDEIATRLFADHVVYVTRALQSSFQDNGRNGRSSIIYNAIPEISSNRRATPPDVDGSAFNIGIVGRLSEVKGHRFLIQAIERLSDLEKIRLNIFGDGPLRDELEDYCERNGLTQAVQFLGFKSNIHEYMCALDLLAMPSLNEGLPYTLLESMYLKVPVIASDVGGLKEILEDGEDSLLIQPGDVESLANSIRYLREHPQERKRLAERAFEKVCRNFSIATMASRYLEVFTGRRFENALRSRGFKGA